jgi:hypothetical protein
MEKINYSNTKITDLIGTGKVDLLKPTGHYNVTNYPWAYDAWQKHQQGHWLGSEIPMSEDLKSWNKDLKDECELKVDTLSPIENDVSGNDHIILYKTMNDGPISSEVESGRYYCISYSDEPDLSLFMDMQIVSSSNVYRLMDTD